MSRTSVEWRLEGNSLLERYDGPDAPMVTLLQMTEKYTKALEFAENDEDKAAAHKNLARTYLWQSEHLKEDPTSLGTVSMVFHSALHHFSEALKYGENAAKSEAWLLDIKHHSKVCRQRSIEFVSQFYHEMVPIEAAPLLKDVINDVRWQFRLRLVDILLDTVETAITNGDLDLVTKLISEAQDVLDLINKPNDEDHRVRECRKSLLKLTKRLRIKRSLTEAISMLDEEDAHLNAVDVFRRVLDETDEDDVRAEAYSYLGDIYDEHRLLPSKAIECYEKTVTLAYQQSHTKEWFIKAINKTKVCQRKMSKRRRIKETITDAETLDLILVAGEMITSGRIVELLLCIYTRIPYRITIPNQPDFKKELSSEAGGIDTEHLKFLIKCLIRHYHPDKQIANSDHTWLDLCNEITSILNLCLEGICK